MFYAHFVLSKKGPLARIWLAAHWDKKLTKAHVFETNIDSSVEAILQPKVKLALRTSGHLLLGVVRIYSRKAKYLLADCNEAFVKIKLAFRPGVVDLPEENREAAVAAITLQENFHDFDTTLADLSDIDVAAQFSVNQSRPEEITMREDLGNITLMGDDGFGDVGFDDRGLLPDEGHLSDKLFKTPEHTAAAAAVALAAHDHHQRMGEEAMHIDTDINPPITDDGFGGPLEDGFGAGVEDDDDDDDNFGGDVDQEFFGDNFMEAGGLFEDPPMTDVTVPQEKTAAIDKEAIGPDTINEVEEPPDEPEEPLAAVPEEAPHAEQTTLIRNEEEAFALEPIDVTTVTGTERRTKRKRKLIVDEQKGIPSESMKMQLSETTDIVTTLDLAPPTKKLMQWKETGGVEKLFILPGHPILSRINCKLFSHNLLTRSMRDEANINDDVPEPLPVMPPMPVAEMPPPDIIPPPPPQVSHSHSITEMIPEVMETPEKMREQNESLHQPLDIPVPDQDSTLVDQSNLAETSVMSRRSDRSLASALPPDMPDMIEPALEQPSMISAEDPFVSNANVSLGDPHLLDDEPPSVAPFSVPPASVPPPSVPPVFEDLDEVEAAMPENEEQEEFRLTKRSQQMTRVMGRAFTFAQSLSFRDLTVGMHRKQMASKFYTLLVLKKTQCIEVSQPEAFGDIFITKGLKFSVD